MNLDNHILVISALTLTSLLVRVAPAFITLKRSSSVKNITEQALPMAVFVNFAVYLMWTEIHIMALAAIVSISIAALITFFTRSGLIVTTCASILVYAAIVKI